MVSYEEQIRVLQTAEAYIATGTHPASYTLNFVEAWMTGVPMIVAGDNIGQPYMSGYQQATYEVAELVQHGYNAFVAHTPHEFAAYANLITSNRGVAEQLSENGRKTAIELFGMDSIKKQWEQFLG
jgi:glycosyltransferase involved in cell wall biosynthesis